MRHAKWVLAGSPLIDGNPGSDAEQIREAEDARHLCARVIDDANFACVDSNHRGVPLGQDFDPFGN
jgi:hypothetical protein